MNDELDGDTWPTREPSPYGEDKGEKIRTRWLLGSLVRKMNTAVRAREVRERKKKRKLGGACGGVVYIVMLGNWGANWVCSVSGSIGYLGWIFKKGQFVCCCC